MRLSLGGLWAWFAAAQVEAERPRPTHETKCSDCGCTIVAYVDDPKPLCTAENVKDDVLKLGA